ncbi:hypothetical protein EBT16_10080, partial [bacterium]|nr:hypothetical protein [bacterium]
KLPTCYTRELRDRPKFVECLTCRLGNIQSYTNQGISRLSDFFSESSRPQELTREWSFSSASTLKRFESPEDYKSDAFLKLVEKLEPSVRLAYLATRKWIEKEKIEALCLFNGRMDVTRGIYEAAQASNIPVVTHERSWFGDGIQLYPQVHCLSLKPVWEMVSTWANKPLTRKQALAAARTGAKRFLKMNLTEWRAYHLNSQSVSWPQSGPGPKVLILPSSSNEIWGHQDWSCQWPDILSGFEAVLDRLSPKSPNVVLRCHPNWGQNIGKQDGSHPERYYSQWAVKKGIHCIGSKDNVDTLDLIAQADIVLVSVSSAALEAGLLGKQIITVSPSNYHTAGFTINAHTKENLETMDSLKSREEVIRKTLRFVYTVSSRLPQYVDHVRAENAFGYKYFAGADPARFMKLFTERSLRADDDQFCSGEKEEDSVIQLLMEKKWKDVLNETTANKREAPDRVVRRPSYRWMDKLRSLAPVGDR